jgi:hypothetical protein
MTMRFVLAAMIALFGIAAGPAMAADDTCAADGAMRFLCGIKGAEDILEIGQTKWLVTSGLGQDGSGGGLHLIDAATRTQRLFYPGDMPAAAPDKATFPDCPGPPDAKSFVAHGISLKRDAGTLYRLYAVNHGREAIEVFTIDTAEDVPTIAWIGCVKMPDGTYTNGVAALPGGGFVATKMYDPTLPNAFADIRAGKVTGLVYQWMPKAGFSVVPGSAMSGPNGIVAAPDGQHIYIAAMGARELVRLSRDGSGPERTAIKIDFMADNLRWTADGKLLAAGSLPQDGATCGKPPCPAGWTVAALDPEAMTIETVLTNPGKTLSGVSVAVKAQGFYWIGSFNGDRIGYVPVK